MRWRIPFVVALVLFVAVNCDQQPIEPAEEAVAEAPNLNFTNGPDHPGNSPVTRGYWDEGCFWCESSDPAGNLYALHYQVDDIFYCGGGSGFAGWDYQGVNNNSGSLWNQQAKSDEPVFIYDMAALFAAFDGGNGFPEPFCTFIAEEWLYAGTHDMIAIDKWMANNTSAYSTFKANGFVYDPDGNRFRYREHQRWDAGKAVWTHEEIRISN